LQYLELVDPNNLKQLETIEDTGVIAIAGYFGSTRLIDNILLNAQKPIVTIDGPAGAGKSTVTRKLAKELGLLYLDTGAMYRAAAWLIKSQAIALEDHVSIAEVMASMQLELLPCDSSKYSCEVYLNQQRITEQIRSLEVTSLVSQIAAIASVRTVLVKLQKELGKKGGLIAEGRDMGTEVFPQASLKIFLTASVAERARRRFKDLQNQGIEKVSLEELIHQITQRDHQDSTRKISPLRKAQDAVEIITDDLNLDQVCVNIVDLYLNKINQK
jgi:pantoate ligase/cytidylate kinase